MKTLKELEVQKKKLDARVFAIELKMDCYGDRKRYRILKKLGARRHHICYSCDKLEVCKYNYRAAKEGVVASGLSCEELYGRGSVKVKGD